MRESDPRMAESALRWIPFVVTEYECPTTSIGERSDSPSYGRGVRQRRLELKRLALGLIQEVT